MTQFVGVSCLRCDVDTVTTCGPSEIRYGTRRLVSLKQRIPATLPSQLGAELAPNSPFVTPNAARANSEYACTSPIKSRVAFESRGVDHRDRTPSDRRALPTSCPVVTRVQLRGHALDWAVLPLRSPRSSNAGIQGAAPPEVRSALDM